MFASEVVGKKLLVGDAEGRANLSEGKSWVIRAVEVDWGGAEEKIGLQARKKAHGV